MTGFQGIPAGFRAALLDRPRIDRDAWLDRTLGLPDLPDDGPDLPRGGVPYLPCAVDLLVEAVDRARLGPSDTIVDVGSGLGRALVTLHLLTGAEAIGIEIQRGLAATANGLADRLGLTHVRTLHGDATTLLDSLTDATVFFLYCPFDAATFARFLDALEPLARRRTLTLLLVDLPAPARDWIVVEPAPVGASEALVVCRTR